MLPIATEHTMIAKEKTSLNGRERKMADDKCACREEKADKSLGICAIYRFFCGTDMGRSQNCRKLFQIHNHRNWFSR
ncbi:hypothetical protein D3C71_1604660 [compost metagenome]